MNTREFVESLTLDKLLAKGGFGEIFLATTDDGEKYVVKSISKAGTSPQNVENEINAGNMLDHNNIVKYHCHFHDEDNYYIVFDYIPGRDLFTVMSERDMKPFNEKEAKHIMKQLVEAVRYSHQEGVAHMDIKLDNIIFNEEIKKVTLLDYGLADFISAEDDFLTKRVGSEEYTAPELFTSKSCPYSSRKADIWSLGVVFFALLTARFPVSASGKRQILKGEHWFPYFGNFAVSEDARDLLDRMLSPNPIFRASMEEILDHPFFL